MCVAILIPAKSRTLTVSELENGWETNSDGGGLAWADPDGKLQMFHSMDRDEFIKRYFEVHEEHNESSALIVHMRIATSGLIDVTTTHPFRVTMSEGELVFAHNGIINQCNPPKFDKTGRSDTMIFRDTVLSTLSDTWLDNKDTVFMVEEYIGWSKLVFLNTSPSLEFEWYIVNEEMGDWTGGIWFSNGSCATKPVKIAVYQGSVSDSSIDRWWEKYDSWDRKPVKTSDDYDWVWSDDTDKGRLFEPTVLAMATWDELDDYEQRAMNDKLQVCPTCFVIEGCACTEICADCYEYMHECDCEGFLSLAWLTHDDEESREEVKF